MNIPPLAVQVGLGWPEPTPFFFVNLFAALATSALLVKMLHDKPGRVTRPAFLLAGLCHVLYQWSVALLSTPVEHSLEHPWRFAFFVHAGVWGLVGWVALSRRLDPRLPEATSPSFRAAELALPILAIAVLAAGYLRYVPPTCTALYSLVVDPHMTLLAREFSGKLVGSALASYSLGAVFNVMAPVVVAMSLRMAWTSGAQRRWVLAPAWIVVCFAAVTVVLITGTKGLLVSTILVVVITSLLWNRRWIVKTAAAGFALGALALGLVSFELVKEREAPAGSGFDFAACSVRVNSCERSITLVQSLKLRDLSLGLPRPLVNGLEQRLLCACAPGANIASCPAVKPVVIAYSQESGVQEIVVQAKPEQEAPVKRKKPSPPARSAGKPGGAAAPAGPTTPEPAPSSADGPTEGGTPTAKPAPEPAGPSRLTLAMQAVAGKASALAKQAGSVLQAFRERGGAFVEAIANRALVVPLQVASWHHMYTETEPNPGAAAIPLANRILHTPINMPEIVYQKYGSMYSSGDRTSTSTAPTGFMLAYPAYVGWGGLILALALVAAYDAAAIWLLRRVRPALMGLAVGLLAVVSMNLAVSDFLTVMGSHGGVVALLLLAAFVAIARFGHGPTETAPPAAGADAPPPATS